MPVMTGGATSATHALAVGPPAEADGVGTDEPQRERQDAEDPHATEDRCRRRQAAVVDQPLGRRGQHDAAGAEARRGDREGDRPPHVVPAGDDRRAIVLGERRVARRLQLVGDLRTAGRHDLAAHQDVHTVGTQLGEQPVVVGDGQHAEPGVVAVDRLRGRLDAAGAGAQGVDVEAGVELVEDRDLRRQHGELQRLVALLLAAREVDVERPVEQALLEADALGLGEQRVVEPVDRRATGGERLAQHGVDGDAGDLGRVLHARGAGRPRRAATSAWRARRRRRA